MVKADLATFQIACVDYITNFAKTSRFNTLIVKSPTGSGKTVMLMFFVKEYLATQNDTVFVWLCPGAGNLEEQSRNSMEDKCPELSTKSLSDVLAGGFAAGDTVFVNWELVTKKGNNALKSGERKNLFERIAQAHRDGLKFILIIDEEQSNDTSKAADVINSFAAIRQVRVSATAKQRSACDFYEVTEEEVIKAHFITKAISINEGLEKDKVTDKNETTTLIDLALKKREEIAKAYKRLSPSRDINPLLIIQFPSSSDALITFVENYLKENNISYDNCLLAKWMADEKDKINLGSDPDWDITDDSAFPIVLLMKQAISTGWDCPRAKVLVKLREHMDEDFEIQTLGRIRRMPERMHYDQDILDDCYLYTLDGKYVESVRQSTNSAIEIKRLWLRKDSANVKLKKEFKNSDAADVEEKKLINSLVTFYQTKYLLDKNYEGNTKKLSDNGYLISDKIIKKALKGRFSTTGDIKDHDEIEEISIEFNSDTHKFGFDRMNAINHIAKSIYVDTDLISRLLIKLFQKTLFPSSSQLLKLSKKEFCAFVINNENKLSEDLNAATEQLTKQLRLAFAPIVKDWSIPNNDLIKFNPFGRVSTPLKKNVYEGYNKQMLSGGLRSKGERLLEEYAETDPQIIEIYKNGDSGIQYFSIVFNDAIGRENLFYPDYILKTSDNQIIIIEVKGGEDDQGTSQNIDRMAPNKFDALKDYAEKYHIKWAFVRAIENDLFFDNTTYEERMDDEKVWRPISEFI